MLKSLFTESTIQAMTITFLVTSLFFVLSILFVVVFDATEMLGAWVYPTFFAMSINAIALVTGYIVFKQDDSEDLNEDLLD